MSLTAPRPTTTAAPPRRLGRRLLGSSLLNALTTPHGVDRYLELVRPAFSLSDVRAEVTGVRRMTHDSVTLTLAPNDNWQGFSAGQHVLVTVEIDGVRRTRSYSPAGSACGAGDGAIELTVKRHEGGLVSRHLNEHARPGLVVGLAPAAGEFVLPARRPERLLLISGGSGITPVMSMLRTLCDEGHAGPVTFLHYSPSGPDTLYRDQLAEIARRHANVDVVHAYTRAEGGDLRGHFAPAHLDGIASGETYVCGPPALIEAVQKAGLEPRFERFTPPPLALVPAGEGPTGTVTFGRADRAAANSGRSLLEQAEAAGLSPAHGCRMGICHTCTCRKVAGAVRNINSGELSSAPDEDIQICVSVPVGDVELAL